jgi:hypothetical protein
MLAGLWTPVMGALIAIDELWIAFSLNSSQPDDRLIHIFLAVLTFGVAMLDPGAWSIDARLFGRKRFKWEMAIGVGSHPSRDGSESPPSRDVIEINLGAIRGGIYPHNQGQEKGDLAKCSEVIFYPSPRPTGCHRVAAEGAAKFPAHSLFT